jgi:hypothetical protein
MAMTLRPDEELAAALAKLAARDKVPQTEVIRRAVLAAARRADEDALVHTLYRDVAATRRSALDRLSES